jgi:hypothetical protein
MTWKSFGNVKRVGGTRTLRKMLELKCKGKSLWSDPEVDGLARYWKTEERTEVARSQKANMGRNKKLETFPH